MQPRPLSNWVLLPNSRALPPAVRPSAFLLQTGLNSLGSTQSGSHSRGPSAVPSFCIGYFYHCDQILKKQCMGGRICSDWQSEGVNPGKGVQTRVALPVLAVNTLYSKRAREMGVATHWLLLVPVPFVCSRYPGSCLPSTGRVLLLQLNFWNFLPNTPKRVSPRQFKIQPSWANQPSYWHFNSPVVA